MHYMSHGLMTETNSLLDEVRMAHRMPRPEDAKRIRQRAGVTQARMAEALGVHPVTFRRWEAGTSTPTQVHRIRYASLLKQLQRALAS